MDEIHKYVPAKHTVDFIPLLTDEPPIPYEDESFHQVILLTIHCCFLLDFTGW